MTVGYFIFLLPVFLKVLEAGTYFALNMDSNIHDQFTSCNTSYAQAHCTHQNTPFVSGFL